jgi:hypothetical protein
MLVTIFSSLSLGSWTAEILSDVFVALGPVVTLQCNYNYKLMLCSSWVPNVAA